MKKFLSLLMSLALVLSFVSIVFAGDNSYSLGYKISKGQAGGLKLVIDSHAIASGLWLGVTLYAPNSKDIPNSQIFSIKTGSSSIEINIEPKYVNGTFEAAVYTKKLNKSECDPKDEFCQKNGYRLIGMTAYIWRYLVSP